MHRARMFSARMFGRATGGSQIQFETIYLIKLYLLAVSAFQPIEMRAYTIGSL